MKKTLIAVLLILAMLFTLTACGDSAIKDITTLVTQSISARPATNILNLSAATKKKRSRNTRAALKSRLSISANTQASSIPTSEKLTKIFPKKQDSAL